MPIEKKSFLRRLSSHLQHSHFVKNVVTVGGGIALSHAIVLVFMPFLTRIYGPEAFGVASVFASLLSAINPASTLGYANAIVMPAKDEEALRVVRLSVLCGFVVSLLAAVIVAVYGDTLTVWLDVETAAWAIYFLPLALLINTFLSVAERIAIRTSFFKAKARAKIEGTLVANVGKLVGGLIVPSSYFLIGFTLFGFLSNFCLQIVHAPRHLLFKLKDWFGYKGLKGVAVEHKDFALYRLPQSVLNSVSTSLPVILLSALFSAAEAGQYSLAVMILGAPAMLIGQAVSEVFYPKITRAVTEENVNSFKLLTLATVALFALALVPFGMVFLWGSQLLPWVFGSEWQLSGQYSQWVSLWIWAVLTASACIATLPVLRRQRFLLINEVISIIARILAFYIGLEVYDSGMVAIVLFCLVNILTNISITLYTFFHLFALVRSWPKHSNTPV